MLLTTLTTVLGLAPLLYEGSVQAEFLKPTVITLVYGLGFGVVMVLFVVPALLSAGQDFSQSLRAGRRALRAARKGGVASGAVIALCVVLLGWFGVTMGAQIVLGRMLLPLAPLPAFGATGWRSPCLPPGPP